MKPCKHTGCNAPEAECTLLCLHRVHTTDLPDDRAAVVMGRTEELPIQVAEEDPPELSRFTFALNTWRLYRRSGCGVSQSLRKAFSAWRGQF